MKAVKLISDSTCDLSHDLIVKHNIEIIPLQVSFGELEYRDGIDLTTPKMYQLVEELNILPKSSAIAPGVFETVFQKYLDQGYIILYIGIGSKFSGTYQSAMLGKSLINSDDIHIVDSNNLSSGIGLLLLKAASFRDAGDDIESIKLKVKELIPKVRSQFVIDTLDYLYKGGRLNALSAIMGKALHIHPVIKVVDGEMGVGKKAIGSMKKGLNLMINEAIDVKDDIDSEFMMITHSLASTYNYVEKKVKQHFEIDTIYETQAGCVISTHCGRGTIGILYIMK